MASPQYSSDKRELDLAAKAIKEGAIEEGRTRLEEVLRRDPNNVLALLWMTKCVAEPAVKLGYFTRVLQLDPRNVHAKKGIDRISVAPSSRGFGQRHVGSRRSAPSPPPALPAQETKQCPFCAETILADAAVCRFCGRDLKAHASKGRAKPVRALLIVATLLACPTLFCFAAYLSAKPPNAQDATSLPPTATLDPETAKAVWGTVDIRELAKNPDRYIGDQLHYQGEVFSIEEDVNGAVIQAWVEIPGGNDFDREAVIVYWPGRTTNVFEGTTIEFWGYGLGSLEGTNAFGGTIRQPLIRAEYATYFR